MKKLFTSAVLTVAAVPFLVAAPAAKTQTQPKASSTAKPKAHKQHVKKTKAAPAGQNASAASTPAK